MSLLAARALLTQIQLSIGQDPQVSFHGPALQPVIPQSLCTSRFSLWQVQVSLQGLSAFAQVQIDGSTEEQYYFLYHTLIKCLRFKHSNNEQLVDFFLYKKVFPGISQNS